MIFYSFFVERWLAATDRLTMTEEAAYLRLINWQYRNEGDLPADMDECYRIARVQSAAERHAVSRVISLFYVETPSGFAQAKVTHEVARFQEGEPARVARREQARLRQNRSRNLQHSLYAMAREIGLSLPRGMKLAELREVLLAHGVPGDKLGPAVDKTGPPRHAVTQRVTQGVTQGEAQGITQGVAEEVTQGVSNVQNPQPIEHAPSEHAPRVREGAAGEACKAMRASGLSGVNPAHPLLLTLLGHGATHEHLAIAAAQAVARGKGFAYALGIVQGQLDDAATVRPPAVARGNGVLAQLAPSVVSRFQSE